jgi:hypothetical protein
MQTTQNRLSGGLLTVLGVLAFGTGVYFLGIRPTLLPEDIRFTGIDDATLPQAFLDWLGIVFRTWGGFITGFGIVIIGIGVATFAADAKWLRYGTAAGILVAFGRFAYSNVVIGDDWKPGP